ncbi:unnamed protein product [Linum trigynum]|uniref:Reverse transcriptase n=1 Tax=Linum trigynum TaxID=586398 RepID=A0AAV2EWH8_9ROSI
MGTRKAPGADGFSALFYRKYWNIIGIDVWQLVRDIIAGSELAQDMNHMLITLIPKVKEPSSPKDFRPISLCNVLYTLVTKVLANRIKTNLERIISPEQIAVVLGRLITDIMMASFECFHSMKKNSKSKVGFREQR